MKRAEWKGTSRRVSSQTKISSERRVTESRKSVHTVHYCSVALSHTDIHILMLEGRAGVNERHKRQ